MTEPLAYLNGRFVLFAETAVAVTDAGFVQGVTVAEQLRTFGGKLFRLDRHLARLSRSLHIIGVSLDIAALGAIAEELAAKNHALLAAGDDLGLTMFVTPGVYGSYAALAGHQGPTVCVHTQPLPFATWVEKYERGESLVVTRTRQVPADCWPVELKCRSRMHYYLADREAAAMQPGARAVLLDHEGFVTESSTANVVAYSAREGLLSPPAEKILPGVSVATLAELAAELQIPWTNRPLLPQELAAADELLLCSTSPCVWSVTQFDGRPLGDGRPGPIAKKLLEAWGKRVQIDIAGQARQFANRAAKV